MEKNITTPKFFGRRIGRKLTNSAKLALKHGQNFFIVIPKNLQVDSNLFSKSHLHFKNKEIIIEIGIGNGDNLVESAKSNPNTIYIGADPFLNAIAQSVKKLLKNNINNVKIWPDDINKIIHLFPKNSISKIKILFPDPWPKAKHKTRRLLQPKFIEILSNILTFQGEVTIGTDHKILKSWILENFQHNLNFEWKAKHAEDWRVRPSDCYQTKYEKKALKEGRAPSWFIFENRKNYFQEIK